MYAYTMAAAPARRGTGTSGAVALFLYGLFLHLKPVENHFTMKALNKVQLSCCSHGLAYTDNAEFYKQTNFGHGKHTVRC